MLTVLTEWCFSFFARVVKSDVAVKIILNSWKLCSQRITSNKHKLQHTLVLMLNRPFVFLSPVCEDHLVSGSFDPPASVCQSCVLGLWLFPAGLSAAWRHHFRRQVRSLQHHQHRLPLLQPGMKPEQLKKIFWQNFLNIVLPSGGSFSVCLLKNLSFQGSFPRSGFTFKVYYPSNRTVEDRWGAFLNKVFKLYRFVHKLKLYFFIFTANFKGSKESDGRANSGFHLLLDHFCM